MQGKLTTFDFFSARFLATTQVSSMVGGRGRAEVSPSMPFSNGFLPTLNVGTPWSTLAMSQAPQIRLTTHPVVDTHHLLSSFLLSRSPPRWLPSSSTGMPPSQNQNDSQGSQLPSPSRQGLTHRSGSSSMTDLRNSDNHSLEMRSSGGTTSQSFSPVALPDCGLISGRPRPYPARLTPTLSELRPHCLVRDRLRL